MWITLLLPVTIRLLRIEPAATLLAPAAVMMSGIGTLPPL
jgi:hypothetical protein